MDLTVIWCLFTHGCPEDSVMVLGTGLQLSITISQECVMVKAKKKISL
jgi:hypothetical protein